MNQSLAPSRPASAAGDLDAPIATERTQLGQAFARKRDALHAALGTQTAAIMSAAAVAHVSTLGALTEREQRMRATFASARHDVRAAQAQQTEIARAEVATALQQLHTCGGVAQVHDAASAEALRMQTAADLAVRNVAASGAALRADITTRPVDVRGEAPDITADDLHAIEASVGEAKAGAANAIVAADREAADKLRAAASENGAAFTSAAATVAEHVNAKLPEAEQSIRSGGDAVAALIDHMAASQLAGIDTAEHQALAQLAEAKTQATQLLGAGRIAVNELSAAVGRQLAELSAQEATAQQQLHAAGAHAEAELAAHGDASPDQRRAFITSARGALREGVQRVIAALDHALAPVLVQLQGAAGAFGVQIRERRDHLLAGIDGAIGSARTALTQGREELIAQCAKLRGDASATYAAAEAQLAANAQPAVLNARDTWRAKADEFIASARAYEAEALGRHAQVRAQLPAKLTQLVHDAVAYQRRSTARRIWDGVKTGLRSIGWGLVKFVVAVAAVAAVILMFVGSAFAGLAVAVAALVVGAVMIAVGVVSSFVARLRMLWNNDWPWSAKILGIPMALGIAVGDALGLSQVAEAIRGRELISNRVLSTEERSSRMTEGLFQVVTFSLARNYMRSRGAKVDRASGPTEANPTRGEAAEDARSSTAHVPTDRAKPMSPLLGAAPTPRVPPREVSPPQEVSPLQEAPPPQEVPPPRDGTPPTPIYDPSTRGLLELSWDRKPKLRAGETQAQAQARARAAAAETLRRSPAIYDALGENPRRVNPRLEDTRHASEGAHTMEKHGADVPLHRADSPGARTIEGRLFGDAPWEEAQSASMRWLSDSLMVRTINEYLQANWERVRSDLALNGKHVGGGNAGAAIGEGYVDHTPNAAPSAKFSVSSLFKVVLLLDDGPPVDFFVYTTYPAPTGIK